MGVRRDFALAGARLTYPVLRLVPGFGPRGSVRVFSFHNVTDDPSPFTRQLGLWTSRATFRSQLSWIVEHFDVVDIRDADLRASQPRGHRSRAVLAFDDSWQGLRRAVEEELAPRSLPATMFLNFGSIDSGVDACALQQHSALNGDDAHARAFPGMDLQASALGLGSSFFEYQGPLLTEPDLAALADLPGISFGSHGYQHYAATDLGPADFEESVRRNEDRLRTWPNRNRAFAFPYGVPGAHFTTDDVATVLRHGYTTAFSSVSRPSTRHASDGSHPRIFLKEHDAHPGHLWLAARRHQRAKP